MFNWNELKWETDQPEHTAVFWRVAFSPPLK